MLHYTEGSTVIYFYAHIPSIRSEVTQPSLPCLAATQSGVLPSLSCKSALAPKQNTVYTTHYGKVHGTCTYDKSVTCYAVHVCLSVCLA